MFAETFLQSGVSLVTMGVTTETACQQKSLSAIVRLLVESGLILVIRPIYPSILVILVIRVTKERCLSDFNCHERVLSDRFHLSRNSVVWQIAIVTKERCLTDFTCHERALSDRFQLSRKSVVCQISIVTKERCLTDFNCHERALSDRFQLSRKSVVWQISIVTK